MSEYGYELTPSAVRDLESIAEYVAVQLCAKESALAPLNEMETAIVATCRIPEAAPPVTDALLARKGYRKLIIKNHIAFYIPDHQARKINVMRAMYFAQDYLRAM